MLRFLIFLLFECSEYLVWHRCADNISTNGSPDYFHRFSSNEIRAYEIEQEYLSAVQDPEPLLFSKNFASVKKMTNIRYDFVCSDLIAGKAMEVIWAPIGGNIVGASVPNQVF